MGITWNIVLSEFIAKLEGSLTFSGFILYSGIFSISRLNSSLLLAVALDKSKICAGSFFFVKKSSSFKVMFQTEVSDINIANFNKHGSDLKERLSVFGEETGNIRKRNLELRVFGPTVNTRRYEHWQIYVAYQNFQWYMKLFSKTELQMRYFNNH